MNPADVLKYGHLTVLKTVDGLPESNWETGGVCGVWSVKDIIAHLASYEHMLEEILSPFAGVEMDTPIMARIGVIGMATYNDEAVEARRGLSSADALTEYRQTCERVMSDLAPKIPAEKWRENGTLPWYGEEYSLEDYIVYTFYGHKREHCAQINVFRDMLKE